MIWDRPILKSAFNTQAKHVVPNITLSMMHGATEEQLKMLSANLQWGLVGKISELIGVNGNVNPKDCQAETYKDDGFAHQIVMTVRWRPNVSSACFTNGPRAMDVAGMKMELGGKPDYHVYATPVAGMASVDWVSYWLWGWDDQQRHWLYCTGGKDAQNWWP